jgi:hypothetical protein
MNAYYGGRWSAEEGPQPLEKVSAYHKEMLPIVQIILKVVNANNTQNQYRTSASFIINSDATPEEVSHVIDIIVNRIQSALGRI